MRDVKESFVLHRRRCTACQARGKRDIELQPGFRLGRIQVTATSLWKDACSFIGISKGCFAGREVTHGKGIRSRKVHLETTEEFDTDFDEV